MVVVMAHCGHCHFALVDDERDKEGEKKQEKF
jgi:hypothetical protein